MSEIIEKVAAALRASHGISGHTFEDDARAAIKALRDIEPTPNMMSAMWSLSFCNTRDSFVECWQALVDAALKEKS